MESAQMLKKTALSLFGLVVMLICFNPPQAHAGVVVSFGRTGMLRLCPLWPTGPLLTSTLRRMFDPAGVIDLAFMRTRISARALSVASSSYAVLTGGGKSSDSLTRRQPR